MSAEIKTSSYSYLEKLLGVEWVQERILGADQSHPLGRWHKKEPNNPIVRRALA
jgi:hypothetical protein